MQCTIFGMNSCPSMGNSKLGKLFVVVAGPARVVCIWLMRGIIQEARILRCEFSVMELREMAALSSFVGEYSNEAWLLLASSTASSCDLPDSVFKLF